MSSYVSAILQTKSICHMNDFRYIITDRMGSFGNQYVPLVWEGECNGIRVSLTYDEVEILFEHGLTDENVYRGEDGKLHQFMSYADNRSFAGAIVCGILSPSTRQTMRREIFDYAQKAKYVTCEEMIPVKMCCGQKRLMFSGKTGMYAIHFNWDYTITGRIENKFLRKFTSNFFKGHSIEFDVNGVHILNLNEHDVFSRENIDLFREYDIQLKYLASGMNKTLLLKAVMWRMFIEVFPSNFLHPKYFKDKNGCLEIPNNDKGIQFNEFGSASLECGKLYSLTNHKVSLHSYIYSLSVPYSESIREIMLNTQTILIDKWEKRFNKNHQSCGLHIIFQPHNETFEITYNPNIQPDIRAEIENDFLTLDYAIKLLQTEKDFNNYQFYSSIFSLLETDSSTRYADEYFSTLKTLQSIFKKEDISYC